MAEEGGLYNARLCLLSTEIMALGIILTPEQVAIVNQANAVLKQACSIWRSEELGIAADAVQQTQACAIKVYYRSGTISLNSRNIEQHLAFRFYHQLLL